MTVVLWWGLFDHELWAEHGEERYGPFLPAGRPIQLHRYRKHWKSRREVRADQVGALAGKLALPRAALSGENGVVMVGADLGVKAAKIPVRPFRDPDPFRELGLPTRSQPGALLPTKSGCRWPSCRTTTGLLSTRCWPGR